GVDGLSMYDFFVFWHHRSMMLSTPPGQGDRNAAHSGPVFLPWHRYMLLMFEFFLRDAIGDDDFRLPYWDWAADAGLPDPTTSAIWSNSRLGQFEQPAWRVRLEPNPTGVNPRIVDRELERALGALVPDLPSRDQVRTVLRDQTVYDLPPYNRSVTGLRNFLEGWIGPGRLHNNVHVFVGGDMLESTSPNDPAFFLHHANVDRIWAGWQAQHPSAPYVPDQNASADLTFHRIDDRMHTFFNHTVTPRMMLDASPWYRYDTLDDL
ncbi:MAG: tyrosinase family protein, partial [bacterium]|nr:tyrosinase family protein [bacterium]